MGCKCSNRDSDISKALNKEELCYLLRFQSELIRYEIQEIRQSKIMDEPTKSCMRINFLATMHNNSLDLISQIQRLSISPTDSQF